MITILKGDTSADISVVLAEGFDYSASTVVVEYQGARRSFGDCRAGAVLTFRFSAEETSPMAFGAHPVSARIVRHDGSIVSVPTSATAIRVTDDPREVHVDGVIAVDVKGGLFGIEDLPERWTEEDVVAKLREILRRGGAVLCALFLAFPCFSASVSTAPKGKIYNDAPVVTNVTFDGLATTDDVAQAIAGMSTITTNDVENIVSNAVPSIVTAVDTIRWEWDLHPYFVSASDPVFRVSNGPDGKPVAAYWTANFTMSDGYVMEGMLSVNPGDGNAPTLKFDQGTAHRVTRNALGLAMLSDLKEAGVPASTVTNIARSVVGSVWDEELGVAWEARMHNGHLYYIAVTNVKQEVSQ